MRYGSEGIQHCWRRVTNTLEKGSACVSNDMADMTPELLVGSLLSDNTTATRSQPDWITFEHQKHRRDWSSNLQVITDYDFFFYPPLPSPFLLLVGLKSSSRIKRKEMEDLAFRGPACCEGAVRVNLRDGEKKKSNQIK